MRNVTMELADPWYHDALVAHDNNEQVSAVGQLVREGNRFTLRSVSIFERAVDQADEPLQVREDEPADKLDP